MISLALLEPVRLAFVREETPAIVDDFLGDSGIYAELSRALPAMLYEYLKNNAANG